MILCWKKIMKVLASKLNVATFTICGLLVGCTSINQKSMANTEKELISKVSFKDYQDQEVCDFHNLNFTKQSLTTALESLGIFEETDDFLFDFWGCRKGVVNNKEFIIYEIWHKNQSITYVLLLTNTTPHYGMVTITDTPSEIEGRQWISQGSRKYDINLKQNLIWKNLVDQYIDQQNYAR